MPFNLPTFSGAKRTCRLFLFKKLGSQKKFAVGGTGLFPELVNVFYIAVPLL
jgi:hypothetical protein